MTDAAPTRQQRISARALLRRVASGVDEVLLAGVSTTGFSAAGTWTLRGGGVDHGEHPEASLRREVREETGLEIGVRQILGVVSRHFTGLSPTGEIEDFHSLHLVYGAVVASDSDEPHVLEVDGTTDAAAWIAVADVVSGRMRIARVVTDALAWEAP